MNQQLQHHQLTSSLVDVRSSSNVATLSSATRNRSLTCKTRADKKYKQLGIIKSCAYAQHSSPKPLTILNKKEVKFQARIWVALCLELIPICGMILLNGHKHIP